MRYLILVCLILSSGKALSEEIPFESTSDPRVRYVKYDKNQIYTLNVRRGNVTRIILGNDEKIIRAGAGFTDQCEELDEWCITADAGTNQIWIKPYEGATHNNLEVATNKRDYSFEFKVLEDAYAGRWTPGMDVDLAEEPFVRLIFHYPQKRPKLPAILTKKITKKTTPVIKKEAQSSIKDYPPVPRNWAYSMNKTKGAEAIVPELVFDDGIFTYFKYPANRPVPAFFIVDSYGKESRVNHHMEGDLAVIQSLASQFTLRRDKAVVGVWNDAYDFDGVAVSSGVTVDGFERKLK
ncbi:MAG: TrbG/VirB9 family P-type conjugative transfer protein [Cellvibrionaceae bacterium]